MPLPITSTAYRRGRAHGPSKEGLNSYLDHPFKGDLVGMTFDDLPRTANWTYYVGNRFPVGGGLTLGLDFEFWHTDYLYLSEGKADRFKFWAMLTF